MKLVFSDLLAISVLSKRRFLENLSAADLFIIVATNIFSLLFSDESNITELKP